jgi:hypothetical protein
MNVVDRFDILAIEREEAEHQSALDAIALDLDLHWILTAMLEAWRSEQSEEKLSGSP